MQPAVYIKGDRKFRNIFFGCFVFMIVMYGITSWLIDKLTTDHISYLWPSVMNFFVFWPLAIYSLYVDLKAFPFLVYPADGTLLPFSTKQRVGLSAKLSGVCGLLCSVLFLLIPVCFTYGFYKIEQISIYQMELKKDIED